ncbi:hypothetical protein SVAN01_08172 [Stagonosporopsis vannaccii]|nr:hypothetical protein SVAN01_08172 [Stagonosporopsis vannaccii]
MPRESIGQVLKFTILPKGVTMTITDVRFTVPGGNNQSWLTFVEQVKCLRRVHKEDPPVRGLAHAQGQLNPRHRLDLTECIDSVEDHSFCIDFTLNGDFFAGAAIKEQNGTINLSTSA